MGTYTPYGTQPVCPYGLSHLVTLERLRMGVLSDSASPFAPLLGRTWGNVKDEETKHEKRANLGNTEREGTGLKLLLQRLCEEEARHSQWPQAMLLLDFLRHRGLKSFPRGIYSSWFLGACGRAGHWSESLKVFHQLKGSTQQQLGSDFIMANQPTPPTLKKPEISVWYRLTPYSVRETNG